MTTQSGQILSSVCPFLPMALYHLLKLLLLLLLLVLLANTACPVLCCYTSIFNFGDSFSDTGNLLYLEGDNPSVKGRFPYGMTYFHHPTGRCSDGRLVIDFIAQALGVPLLHPYLIPNNNDPGFKQGVNFAVAGATALDDSFFKNKNVNNPYAIYSLNVQLGWFKQLLPSLCHPTSDCKDFFSRSLFVVGVFGGNDYFYPSVAGESYEDVRKLVPLIINATSQAIQTLIKLGAQTLLIPGEVPVGCSSMFLTMFKSPNKEFYDPKTGCLKWLNKFAKYHNNLLQKELDRLRKLHPETTIIFADYYNSAMRFYHSPSQFGFSKGALAACCGGEGPYNFNLSAGCGRENSKIFGDPSMFANWDGRHLTEAAYRTIATSILDGSYSIPPINISCLAPIGDIVFDPK